MRKTSLLYLSLGIVGLCLVIIFLSTNIFSNKTNDVVSNEINTKKYFSSLAMMLENSHDSGEYIESANTSWEDVVNNGYIYNDTLSKCENGSTLTWNSDNKTVVFTGNTSDKCYVYFDLYLAPSVNSVAISNNTVSGFRTTVSVSAGDGSISKYYFSVDNKTWYESSTNYYDFTGLSLGTTYTLYCYVVDTNGVSSNIITGTGTTLSATPPTITSVNNTCNAGYEAYFSVQAEEGSFSIENYYYAIVSAGDACPEVGSNSYILGSNSITVDSLNPLTNYTFCTYVTDISGLSSEVKSYNFSTLDAREKCLSLDL